MLRLAIVRHAEAVPLAEGGDIERPLSASGQAMAERMGRYFRDSGFEFDLALVSPSRRTRETFDGLQIGAEKKFPVDYVPAIYNAGLETLEAILAEVDKDVKFLLLVGHNPGFAELADSLAAKGKKSDLARMREHFPTPCLALIEFDVKSWKKALPGEGKLELFVTRGALAKMDESS